MGYESRIIVVNKNKHSDNIMSWGDVIAVVNMSVMSGSFLNLFTEKVDYTVYREDGNTKIETDEYDSPIKYAPINKVIEWVEQEIKESNYRRLKPLLGLLKGFDQSRWDELQVIHYGY